MVSYSKKLYTNCIALVDLLGPDLRVCLLAYNFLHNLTEINSVSTNILTKKNKRKETIIMTNLWNALA